MLVEIASSLTLIALTVGTAVALMLMLLAVCLPTVGTIVELAESGCVTDFATAGPE